MTDKPVTTREQMSALDYYIPQLPDGWALHQLQERHVDGLKSWFAQLYRPYGTPGVAKGVGKSPREAILRSLDDMEKSIHAE